MSFDPKKPYNLEHLSKSFSYDKALYADLISETRDILGEIRGACRAMPDTKILSYPTLLKEAVDSSQIENIETTVEKAMENVVVPENERTDADKSVIKYREAAYWGYEKIEEWGITTRVIWGLLKTLLPESSGTYRLYQNHIENKSTGEIVYTPPEPRYVAEYVKHWEKFVNELTPSIDPLVKAIISHYQFEAIHPFDDGNGRVGRMLMILILINEKVLSQPVLHISSYINSHKPLYYESLASVSRYSDFNKYLKFMLDAFHIQAKETLVLVNRIIDLFDNFKKQMRANQNTSSLHNIDLIAESVFTDPVITPSLLTEKLKLAPDTASSNLRKLEKAGLMSFEKKGKYSTYKNIKLLEILK